MSLARSVICRLAPRMLAGCLLLVAAFGSSLAHAQDSYLELPYADDLQTESARSNLQSMKAQVLAGNQDLDGNLDNFRRWYQGYQFPQMTRWNSENLAQVRRDLYNDIERSGRSKPNVHRELVDLCLGVSKRIVSENYHPAVRYNFMRLLGDLNETESVSGAPPVPLSDALVVMLSELNNAEQIDAVRVAALIGIERHVQTLLVGGQAAGLDSKRANITTAMLTLLDSLEARPDATAGNEGLAWMKRQAIEILGHLGQVGENGQVYAAVMSTLSNEQEPLFLRCAAANALSMLSFPAAFDAAADEIYTQLGRLAFDCCNRELNRVQSWQLEHAPDEDGNSRGGPSVPGRGRPGRGSNFDAEATYEAGSLRQALAMRSILKEQLGYIRKALANTESLGSGSDERDLYSDVNSAVVEALKTLDERDEDEHFHLEDFIAGVEGPTLDLEDLLLASEEEAAEAEATDVDELLGSPEDEGEPSVDPLLGGDEEEGFDPTEDFVPPGT